MKENIQQLGCPVSNWRPPPHPSTESMNGRFCRLEQLDPERHAACLYEANRKDIKRRNWTYLPYGPFETLEAYRAWMEEYCCGRDPLFYAILDSKRGVAVGVASYLR